MPGVRSCLLLAALALCCSATAVHALPDTWMLLPVLSIGNTTLTAGHDCHPTYTAAPCAGHGDCYLLLDSADPASRPYVQAASQPPLPVSASNLDPDGIDATTPLPTSVCLCHGGYTGRADYVPHDARDGDSCAVYQPAINALAAAGCALFSLLLLLALVRLHGWYAWHRSTVLAAAALSAHPPTSEEPLRVAVLASPYHSTPSQLSSTTVIASPVNATIPTMDALRLPSRGSAVRSAVQPSKERVDFERRTRTRLIRHLQHDSFLHPSCALVLSLCSLLYFILRLATTLTIGDSYGLSAIIYLQHLPHIVASSLGVAGTLQLAASVAKLKLVNGVDVIAVTKKCLIGLCLYQFVAWILLFFLFSNLDQQVQLSVQLFLVLCYCPDFLLGPITVLAVRRINHVLLTNLANLSAEQRQLRRAVHQKMQRMAIIVAVLTLGNSATCLWLTASSRARQHGLPYYVLIWHYSVFVLIGVRLALVQPPRPIGAVCPLPQRLGAASGGTSSHNSSGHTSASSRPAPGHARHKSMGGLRTSTGSSLPQHAVAQQPKLIVVAASTGRCESVTETERYERPPGQWPMSPPSVVSED